MPMRQPFFPGGAAARIVSPPMMTAQCIMSAFFRMLMSWSAMYPLAIPPRSSWSGLRKVMVCSLGSSCMSL